MLSMTTTNKEIAERTGIPASNLSRWKHLEPKMGKAGVLEPVNHRFTFYNVLLNHPEMVALMEQMREKLDAQYAEGS